MLIKWVVHLLMNKGGKWSSYKEVVKLIKQCPYEWIRCDEWGENSAFINLCNKDFSDWMIHADMISLGGIKRKLGIISYFKFHKFLNNMKLRNWKDLDEYYLVNIKE